MVSGRGHEDGEIEPGVARAIVRDGYDRMADRYAEWAAAPSGGTTERFLERIVALVPDGAEVLDLGCGAGVPVAAALAGRCRVTGVDGSSEQVIRARTRVPEARFEHADIATLARPEASLDVVTAFYSLTHLPRADQTAVIERAARWLRPGGLFCATLGDSDNAGAVEADWLGVPMFFAGFTPEANRRLLAEAGFVPEYDEVCELDEEDGLATFHYVIERAGG
jgi:ubiquinone/menaquinone biosynthesis C-methylase UbiE